jgi:uncharacterized protein
MSTTGVKVVIDTNIFITILGTKSPNRWIFNKIKTGEFELCVSNEILWEYEEILTRKTNQIVARNIIDFLLIHPYVHFVDVYFNWKLIEKDPDDNKFIDCAVSSEAYCLVTNDHHFDVARNLDFPPINIVNLDEFKEEFNP